MMCLNPLCMKKISQISELCVVRLLTCLFHDVLSSPLFGLASTEVLWSSFKSHMRG
jgi:hypothetical protein